MIAPTKRRRFHLGSISVALLAACAPLGPGRIPTERFNYNEAISRSTKEQTLLNLLRLRHLDVPEILYVGSVVSQYSFEGGIGLLGIRGFQGGTDSISGNANLNYAERPTITYSPVSGPEFASRLLTPLPLELLFSLQHAGWPVDLLLLISLQRINDVENMSFAPVPPSADLDRNRLFQRNVEKLRAFESVLRDLLELADRGALELQRDEKDDALYWVFREKVSPDVQALAKRLKSALGLDPLRQKFRITQRLTGRKPDEITIQPRSLLAIMYFLARGIEIPTEHQKDGRVVAMDDPAEFHSYHMPVPLRVRVQAERPGDAFIAVPYQGHWFYIDSSDLESKRAFGVMRYLFLLQAPPPERTATPLLTLPTGR
jgi:hypothetical protein